MSHITYVFRRCLCDADITSNSSHYCTLLKRNIGDAETGPPVIDYNAMAQDQLDREALAADTAESKRMNAYTLSYAIAGLTGNALMGMQFGGDAMGAAAGAAEKRGETLEKVLKDNNGDIRNHMVANGMDDAQITQLLDAYNRKKDSWF